MGCGVSLRRRERGMAALLIFDLWPVDTYVWWLATLWDPHLRGLSRSVLSIRPLAVREPDWDIPLNSEAIKAILAFQIVDRSLPIWTLYNVYAYQRLHYKLLLRRHTCRWKTHLPAFALVGPGLGRRGGGGVQDWRTWGEQEDANAGDADAGDDQVGIQDSHRTVDPRKPRVADAGVHVWTFLGGGQI